MENASSSCEALLFHSCCWVRSLREEKSPLFSSFFSGGGGYTVKNVSRCWTYETAIALNQDISNELPYCKYFAIGEKLHIVQDDTLKNDNTKDDLNRIVKETFEKLREIQLVPSVQFQETEEDAIDIIEIEKIQLENISPDQLNSSLFEDMHVIPDNEFF